MWRRYNQIFIVLSGSAFLIIGVIFSFSPELLKRSEVMTTLFIGIGLIILTGLAKKKSA
ncbi:MAG TPA: hypothetical protein VLY20_05650 [Nitrospiria bacterium]|nr:hypothetical protein [Nitrospiria bacterium]